MFEEYSDLKTSNVTETVELSVSSPGRPLLHNVTPEKNCVARCFSFHFAVCKFESQPQPFRKLFKPFVLQLERKQLALGKNYDDDHNNSSSSSSSSSGNGNGNGNNILPSLNNRRSGVNTTHFVFGLNMVFPVAMPSTSTMEV